jgi:hypothetical protein
MPQLSEELHVYNATAESDQQIHSRILQEAIAAHQRHSDSAHLAGIHNKPTVCISHPSPHSIYSLPNPGKPLVSPQAKNTVPTMHVPPLHTQITASSFMLSTTPTSVDTSKLVQDKVLFIKQWNQTYSASICDKWVVSHWETVCRFDQYTTFASSLDQSRCALDAHLILQPA